jgi:hypothetical protein
MRDQAPADRAAPASGGGPILLGGRVAARYRLAPAELLAALVPDGSIRAADVWALDAVPDRRVETALAVAAGLPPGTVAGLRGPGAVWSRRRAGQPVPHSWCQACVREDLERYGETYDRAAWSFGGFVVCPSHRQVLGRCCPICGESSCTAVAPEGRRRLLCDRCGIFVDGLRVRPDREALWPYTVPEAPWGVVAARPVVLREGVGAMLLSLQADLVAAAHGLAPLGPLALRLAPDRLLWVSRRLAVLAMSCSAWERGEERFVDGGTGGLLPEAADTWTPGALSPRGAIWVMAVVGPLLSEIAGAAREDVVWKELWPVGSDRPVTLASVLEGAGMDRRAALVALAAALRLEESALCSAIRRALTGSAAARGEGMPKHGASPRPRRSSPRAVVARYRAPKRRVRGTNSQGSGASAAPGAADPTVRRTVKGD